MSAMAGITVYDGAATPVLHTLNPIEVSRPTKDKVMALWRESPTNVPLNACISCEMSLERLPNGIYKAYQRVNVPVMESVSGQNAAGYTAAPKVAFVDSIVTIGYFSDRSTVEKHRLARQISTNIQGNVTTSVAAPTSGPAAELFDFLILPT